MGIGISIFLIAVGAVLAWAVEVQAQGIDLNAVGVILMIVGLIGLVASMLFWSPWAPYSRGGGREVVRDREVVDRDVR